MSRFARASVFPASRRLGPVADTQDLVSRMIFTRFVSAFRQLLLVIVDGRGPRSHGAESRLVPLSMTFCWTNIAYLHNTTSCDREPRPNSAMITRPLLCAADS